MSDECEVQQVDRDIANELSQNLGTLAQDFRLLKANGGLEAMKIFDEACLRRTEQLFARHRHRAELAAQPPVTGPAPQAESKCICTTAAIVDEFCPMSDKWHRARLKQGSAQPSPASAVAAQDFRQRAEHIYYELSDPAQKLISKEDFIAVVSSHLKAVATPAGEASLREAVKQLQNHIEDIVDNENWEKISTELWNRVSSLATQPQPEGKS